MVKVKVLESYSIPALENNINEFLEKGVLLSFCAVAIFMSTRSFSSILTSPQIYVLIVVQINII